MDLQQNTEFVLAKMDSLIQKALPTLQSGAEEVIRYKVIEFRANALVQFVAFTLILIVGIYCLKRASRLYNELTEPNFDFGVSVVVGAIGTVIGVVTVIVTVIPLIPSFVLSFTSPEIFAIMQLIGK